MEDTQNLDVFHQQRLISYYHVSTVGGLQLSASTSLQAETPGEERPLCGRGKEYIGKRGPTPGAGPTPGVGPTLSGGGLVTSGHISLTTATPVPA